MLWRIYYADGSTYSNEDGSAWDAPACGVQILVKNDPENGRYLLAQFDYYYYIADADDWYGTNEGGLWASYLLQPGQKKVVVGQWAASHVYQDCVKRAMSDPGFPEKSARHEGERY